ncbi:hypothetical protein JKI95_08305 [Corynebacterium aquatimens]|uniref:hypothetical protein n=1 Tax=Corynebacterium aquatimens TaxID=1190508 RepID=UPI002541C565|nr:hypothetical protein [Corynebacterium aquatimens]QYH19211.1 hypothetical protein JKI95_08305 [Corynebacterium aquatimens]
MRKLFTRGTEAPRLRAGGRLRGVSAAVLSAALVVGSGAYPAEGAAQTQEGAATQAPAATPVNVTRTSGVDTVTVTDPTGEAWAFGAKASAEDIFALKRVGAGEIEEILSITADGKELAPEFYGYVNTAKGGYLAFDLDALDQVPPRGVTIEARTSGDAAYSVAESVEVPSARELSASGYGRNPPPRRP